VALGLLAQAVVTFCQRPRTRQLQLRGATDQQNFRPFARGAL